MSGLDYELQKRDAGRPPWLLRAFQLWRDVREFEKVSVDPETATVTWDGGIRLDADILYHDVKANQIQRAGAGETPPVVG